MTILILFFENFLWFKKKKIEHIFYFLLFNFFLISLKKSIIIIFSANFIHRVPNVLREKQWKGAMAHESWRFACGDVLFLCLVLDRPTSFKYKTIFTNVPNQDLVTLIIIITTILDWTPISRRMVRQVNQPDCSVSPSHHWVTY